MLEAMCSIGDSYRAEDGERGDGREPPQARNGRRVRSEAEFLQPRPPDGAKRRRVALAELGHCPKGCKCDGVGSRREETPRGKGAKRPVVIQKSHIDDGCLGGGENDLGGNPENLYIFIAKSTYNNPVHFRSDRKPIFSYCLLTKGINNPNDPKNAETLSDLAFALPIYDSSETQIAKGLGNYLTLHNLIQKKEASNDFDGDGLSDWAEAWFGSDPNANGDSDEDGMPDLWEAKHSTYPYEANPAHKDIFIELDWMGKSVQYGRHWIWERCGPGCSQGLLKHYGPYNYCPGHKLSSTVIDDVIKVFRQAPVSNYDEVDGINLHIDDGYLGGGDSIVHKYHAIFEDDIMGDYSYYSSDFLHKKQGYFHYGVVAHSLGFIRSGKSDTGEIVFSFEDYPLLSVHLFVHELGHNILGDPNSRKGYGSHRDPESGHCSHYGTCTMMKNTFIVENYCSDCWDDLDLANSFS